jgi:hypothetical protein
MGMRRVGHEVSMGESSYGVFVGKPEGKRVQGWGIILKLIF